FKGRICWRFSRKRYPVACPKAHESPADKGEPMTVRYITVKPIANFFKPATRSFGDIAVVGGVASDANGPIKVPVAITNPDAVSLSVSPTLSGAVADAAATTVTVQSASGFPTVVPFSIQIEQEVLKVTAANGTNWTVTRAQAGSTAAAHADKTTV